MAASRIKPSPIKIAPSPDISVTQGSPAHTDGSYIGTSIGTSVNTLFPGLSYDRRESDADSRYFTASSGDERFDDDDDYNDDDDDDDDDGMCIMLGSDDDDADGGSLSGLHINLKTLQAVSNMLAHYSPIIQRDINGNPVFVAPPPPSGNASTNATPAKATTKSPISRIPLKSPSVGDGVSDFEMALQELEDVITAEEDVLFVDRMTELTELTEKMTYFSAEDIDDI